MLLNRRLSANGTDLSNPQRERGRPTHRKQRHFLADAAGYFSKVSAIGLSAANDDALISLWERWLLSPVRLLPLLRAVVDTAHVVASERVAGANGVGLHDGGLKGKDNGDQQQPGACVSHVGILLFNEGRHSVVDSVSQQRTYENKLARLRSHCKDGLARHVSGRVASLAKDSVSDRSRRLQPAAMRQGFFAMEGGQLDSDAIE